MFTRNWYAALAMQLYTGNGNTDPSEYSGVIKNLSGALPSKVHDLDNVIYNGLMYPSNGSAYTSLNYLRTSFTSYGGVVLGTGSATPTIDDYCLSGDLITTFTYSAITSFEIDDSGVTYKAEYTITNTGSESFTIGEIGLIALSYSSTAESYKCLLERTVLGTPVTIEAGGVGQVTYEIRMNYPWAT